MFESHAAMNASKKPLTPAQDAAETAELSKVAAKAGKARAGFKKVAEITEEENAKLDAELEQETESGITDEAIEEAAYEEVATNEEVAADLAATQEQPKRKPGRPRKETVVEAPAEETTETWTEPLPAEGIVPGFRLYIGCLPLGNGLAFVDVSTILQREGPMIAEAKGQDSYFLVNSFERRDMLRWKAAEFAAHFVNTRVVALSDDQDTKALVEALRPFAEETIVPLAKVG
jgi:hypothetical protein